MNFPNETFSMVIHLDRISGLYIGDVEESWSRAADLSAKLHVKFVKKPFQRILGLAPLYYNELWVAGKVMYKLEPIVADGGELIIHAPNVKTISYTYEDYIRRIGYHVRDYFLKQMDQFLDVPRGVLAHIANLKGIGTYENGIERPRIKVTLATGIPEKTCQALNLGYLDPETIDLHQWSQGEEKGILTIENAGEILYRLG